MSHVVIRSVPFATRLRATPGSARELLSRDRARAQKFLAGKSPHGPLPFVDARSRRHGHHHKGTVPTTPAAPAPTTTVSTGGGSTSNASSIDVTDSGVTYTMQVGVGNPATQYTLLIDTGQCNSDDIIVPLICLSTILGSSNTWIGASTPYTPTSTSHNTGNTIVSYLFSGFSYD